MFLEPTWLVRETPRNCSMLAAGERECEWARRRARGCAGARGGGVRRAHVQARRSLRLTLQTRRRWTPVRGGGAHRGPASDRLRYTTVFRPAGRQNVGLSQPLARGGVVPPAGRRVWGPTPPAKPTCPQQRRRYPGFASTGACRFIAHVRLGRSAASRG